MTGLENRSASVTDTQTQNKNPFLPLSPTFWREKKLAIVGAWLLCALLLVAFTLINHKQPQAEVLQIAQLQQEASSLPPEPFDITLTGEPLDAPVVPVKASAAVSVKVQKVVVQKEEVSKPEKEETLKRDKEEVSETRKAMTPKSPAKEAKAKATKAAATTKAKVKEAAPAVEKAKAPDPAVQAEHQIELARQSMQSGDIKQAIIHQHRAVELDPANMLYRLNLGIMHDRAADKEGATTLYRQIIDAYERGDKSLPKIDIEDVRNRLDYVSNDR